ncbi:hypothetical protein Nepgr_028315 [Nepenthes gracilis]|uniref:Uncharacterized protein n=1 Tax=Nepenthes gracilis TaxID=150966 RepID=A0AAD3Y202_NEPGR|nr:hypothetical protein Nepgr_028315 [Nepenthes gracilis]
MVQVHVARICVEMKKGVQPGPLNEELDIVANDTDNPTLDVRYADVSSVNALDQQSCNPAPVVCLARGLASSMSAHQIVSGPLLTTSAKCSSGLVGEDYENDVGPSGPIIANVDTISERPVLVEDTQNVADHAGRSFGVANSVVIGPIPGVDDSTPESIARITRKYSLAEVEDVSLIKAPSEFPVDSLCSLPGCPVEGYVDSMTGAVMPRILELGLVHTMPISSIKPELSDLGAISQVDGPPVSMRCLSPRADVSHPANHAKSSVTMDAGSSVGPALSSANPVAAELVASGACCRYSMLRGSDRCCWMWISIADEASCWLDVTCCPVVLLSSGVKLLMLQLI